MGGREYGDVSASAAEKPRIQTTNLRVGRSNRSGRAIFNPSRGLARRLQAASNFRLRCQMPHAYAAGLCHLFPRLSWCRHCGTYYYEMAAKLSSRTLAE